MSCQVVTVANRVPGPSEPYYKYGAFINSLAKFGVTPTVLGMHEHWQGLMTKPRRLRKWLREGNCKTDTLIVSDAFDVLFAAHPDKVAEKWGGGDDVLFNAERGLFPRNDLAHAFPECGTPWRYLNSGLFIGKPANILAMLEGMNMDDIRDDEKSKDDLHGGVDRWIYPNDQGHYQLIFAAKVVPMRLDYKCELFQCFSACDINEFEISENGMKNLITGTEPMIGHFNGNSKDLYMPKFMEKWGITE